MWLHTQRGQALPLEQLLLLRCWWVGGGCLVEGCRIAVRRLDGGQEPLAVFGMIALGLANAKLTGNLAD